MGEGLNRMEELQRCYRILDVPTVSSASTIKLAYRRLLKRWHPDLYPPASPSYSEATTMTALLNEAYRNIQNAPLRYYVRETATPSVRHRSPEPATVDEFPDIDTARIEFWVRFVCGFFVGIFLGLDVLLKLAMSWDFHRPEILIAGTLAFGTAVGFASAQSGDQFWYAILDRWWRWP